METKTKCAFLLSEGYLCLKNDADVLIKGTLYCKAHALEMQHVAKARSRLTTTDGIPIQVEPEGWSIVI